MRYGQNWLDARLVGGPGHIRSCPMDDNGRFASSTSTHHGRHRRPRWLLGHIASMSADNGTSVDAWNSTPDTTRSALARRSARRPRRLGDRGSKCLKRSIQTGPLSDQQVRPIVKKRAALSRYRVTKASTNSVPLDGVTHPTIDGEADLRPSSFAQRNGLHPKPFPSTTRGAAQQGENAPLSDRLH